MLLPQSGDGVGRHGPDQRRGQQDPADVLQEKAQHVGECRPVDAADRHLLAAAVHLVGRVADEADEEDRQRDETTDQD